MSVPTRNKSKNSMGIWDNTNCPRYQATTEISLTHRCTHHITSCSPSSPQPPALFPSDFRSFPTHFLTHAQLYAQVYAQLYTQVYAQSCVRMTFHSSAQLFMKYSIFFFYKNPVSLNFVEIICLSELCPPDWSTFTTVMAVHIASVKSNDLDKWHVDC